jgi:hypothetical protein
MDNRIPTLEIQNLKANTLAIVVLVVDVFCFYGYSRHFMAVWLYPIGMLFKKYGAISSLRHVYFYRNLCRQGFRF